MAMYKSCKYCNKKYEYDAECTCDGVKKAKQNRQQHYDKYVRKSNENKKYDSFYHSIEWKRFTEYIKNKYNNLCLMCLIKDNIITKYDVIHHIYEIKTIEGWEHRFNSEMVVPLCHGCHNRLHVEYGKSKIDDLISIMCEYREKF